MHGANQKFWKYCSETYPEKFQGDIKVIEYGSYDINGSIREFFKFPLNEYIGVDWRPQPGWRVELVSLAHEVSIPYPFDTVASASLLEHDPYWKLSLQNMVEHLKEDGILILSWGAALNAPHCFVEAPDGEFHALKVGSALKRLNELGIYVHEVLYEGNHFQGGMGEVCLIGFKDKSLARGPQRIDQLLPEDVDE